MKIIYDSPLQNELINEASEIKETVIPMLVTYKSLLTILKIKMQKQVDAQKAKEKAEREAKIKGITVKENQQEEEEKKESGDNKTAAEKIMMKRANKDQGEEDHEFDSELQKQKEAERKDIEQYGRTWIWESYFNP